MREPRPGCLPSTSHRPIRDTERLGSLGLRQATEEATLDDGRHPRVQLGEMVEGVVNRQHDLAFRGQADLFLVEGQERSASSTTVGLGSAEVVDQDLPHNSSAQR